MTTVSLDDQPLALRQTYEVVISLRVEASASAYAITRTVGMLPADIGEVTYVSCEVTDR